MRFAVLGLGAAGSACVARLLDLAGPSDEVLALERSDLPPPSPALWPEYAAGVVDEAVLSESAPWRRWVAGSGERIPPRLTAIWGKEATRLDAAARRLYLDGGEVIAYDRLLVATGASAVTPDIRGLRAIGAPGAGIHSLGGVGRIESLRRDLAGCPPGAPVAVAGAGPSGVRMAELLHDRGFRVTLLEARPFLLPALSSPATSEVLSLAARKAGIRVETGVEVQGAVRDSSGVLTGLVCGRGGREAVQPCNLAVFCTGFSPRNLPGDGLEGDNGAPAPQPAAAPHRPSTRGLPVSQDMSVQGLEGVFAAGDCALPGYGWTAPPGLWPVASWQGRQAALAMAGLEGAPLPSRVVLTVRFLGLLVTGSRPYAPSDDCGREGISWKVEVGESSAAQAHVAMPPEVLEVAD